MKIIADIDTLSESRTTPVWILLEKVKKKIEKLKKMVVDEEWNILDEDEIEFRNIVFPGKTKVKKMVVDEERNILDVDESESRNIVFQGKTKFNLMGRGFQQWQHDELHEEVF